MSMSLWSEARPLRIYIQNFKDRTVPIQFEVNPWGDTTFPAPPLPSFVELPSGRWHGMPLVPPRLLDIVIRDSIFCPNDLITTPDKYSPEIPRLPVPPASTKSELARWTFEDVSVAVGRFAFLDTVWFTIGWLVMFVCLVVWVAGAAVLMVHNPLLGLVAASLALLGFALAQIVVTIPHRAIYRTPLNWQMPLHVLLDVLLALLYLVLSQQLTLNAGQLNDEITPYVHLGAALGLGMVAIFRLLYSLLMQAVIGIRRPAIYKNSKEMAVSFLLITIHNVRIHTSRDRGSTVHDLNTIGSLLAYSIQLRGRTGGIDRHSSRAQADAIEHEFKRIANGIQSGGDAAAKRSLERLQRYVGLMVTEQWDLLASPDPNYVDPRTTLGVVARTLVISVVPFACLAVIQGINSLKLEGAYLGIASLFSFLWLVLSNLRLIDPEYRAKLDDISDAVRAVGKGES
jgi:hypothetical protein